ncbi:MAG: hypothetical protein WBR24_05540 [Desulfobacterales bacterium]
MIWLKATPPSVDRSITKPVSPRALSLKTTRIRGPFAGHSCTVGACFVGAGGGAKIAEVDLADIVTSNDTILVRILRPVAALKTELHIKQVDLNPLELQISLTAKIQVFSIPQVSHINNLRLIY